VVDYASASAVEDIVSAIQKVGADEMFVIDPISSPRSATPAVEVLKRVGTKAKVANTLPWPAGLEIPEGVEVRGVDAGDLWGKGAFGGVVVWGGVAEVVRGGEGRSSDFEGCRGGVRRDSEGVGGAEERRER